MIKIRSVGSMSRLVAGAMGQRGLRYSGKKNVNNSKFIFNHTNKYNDSSNYSYWHL